MTISANPRGASVPEYTIVARVEAPVRGFQSTIQKRNRTDTVRFDPEGRNSQMKRTHIDYILARFAEEANTSGGIVAGKENNAIISTHL
jgi:hypothetical protein